MQMNKARNDYEKMYDLKKNNFCSHVLFKQGWQHP